jgi:2-polyprenyl-3-methyl-5-hydroxy-6-metoxy-1,4-benzoquinol methylase
MDEYYMGDRVDLRSLVPARAMRVLDVGCGAGMTGLRLRQERPGLFCAGIELLPEAADAARQRLDAVACLDLDAAGSLPFPPASFDAIICGDVLEHLKDPERVIGLLRELLSPTGVLIWSVPNVRHFSVIASLMLGEFSYTRAGILDRTHLRFFTRRSAYRFLENAGFVVLRVEPKNWDPSGDVSRRMNAWQQRDLNRKWRAVLRAMLPEAVIPRTLDADSADLLTLQYVFIATRTETSPPPVGQVPETENVY